MTTRIPARMHTKRRLPYHARIQKKWNKRFGFAKITREPSGIPALDANPGGSVTLVALGRRGRAAVSAARAAMTPEQQRQQYRDRLVALCESMIEQCRIGGWTKVQFNVADEQEQNFIKSWMATHAPTADVVFNIERANGTD